MKRRIFISHAVKDKPLADELVDLLQTGVNISSEEIFCSSLEGLGIPSGKNFIEYIKSQLKEPDTVITILSPNYLSSHFCLCELGATWAMSHNILPLLVPPLTHKQVTGVLTETQVNKVTDTDALNDFVSELKNHLNIEKINLARWERKKKKFLDNLQEVLDELPTPKTVTTEKHEEIQELYKESQEALDEADETIAALEAKIEKLKKCKDAEAVTKVEKELLSDQGLFQELVEKVDEALGQLPRSVPYFVFKMLTGQDEVKPNVFEERELVADAEDATEEDFLLCDEGVFSVNDDDPKVENAISAINDLTEFLENEASAELYEVFKKENNYALSVTNKRFWRDYFSSGSSYL